MRFGGRVIKRLPSTLGEEPKEKAWAGLVFIGGPAEAGASITAKTQGAGVGWRMGTPKKFFKLGICVGGWGWGVRMIFLKKSHG